MFKTIRDWKLKRAVSKDIAEMMKNCKNVVFWEEFKAMAEASPANQNNGSDDKPEDEPPAMVLTY